MIAYTESCPVRQGVFNGGIAQLARACGSYPQCPRFKSRCRYQTPKDGTAPSFGTSLQEYPAPLGQPGPLVKWLRHRPFTAVTRVRVPYGSPIYGGVAQPVEHLLHTQGVTDSSSVVSTRKGHPSGCPFYFVFTARRTAPLSAFSCWGRRGPQRPGHASSWFIETLQYLNCIEF